MTGHFVAVWMVLGLMAITLAMVLAVTMVIRVKGDPTPSGARGEAARRGDNAGGAVLGSRAQQTRRDEARRIG